MKILDQYHLFNAGFYLKKLSVSTRVYPKVIGLAA